jgi:hypothetical protein
MANRFDTRELSRLLSMREKKGQVEKGTGHVVTPATHSAHAVFLATNHAVVSVWWGLLGSA